MQGKEYPGNVWASQGTPKDMLRVQYRHMQSAAGRANVSSDWWEINVRACMARAWRLEADGKAQGVQFAPLDTLGDGIAEHLAKWLQLDLGDVMDMDAVTITAKRTTTSYVEVRMDFATGTMPWETRQLIIAAGYEICRRAAGYWLMDQVQFAIEDADAEVMTATLNLERAKRWGARFPKLVAHQRQAGWLIAAAEERLAKAREAVTRLESLEEPLTGDEALRYWKARERRDDEDAAPITAMIRRYVARHGERYLAN